MAKYSSLSTLLRVCALLYKFGTSSIDPIENDRKARLFLLKIMQQESFPVELRFLREIQSGSTSSKPPDLVSRLNFFLDDLGLIRSKGRLSRTNYYSFEIVNPVVLSKSHHLTTLIVRDAHVSCKHLGIQATLTFIRLKGYWITSARHTIRRVLSECVTCTKFNSFSYSYPKFTNFTKAQVNFYRPFSNVGVDFTKHFFIKLKGSTQPQKMYILLYTCLNIRCVYLDLIPDMSARAFVQSFQRFVARFGVPEFLYSDNARSFNKGADALEQFVVSEVGSEFLRKNHIKHIRIPLYSPWMGSI